MKGLADLTSRAFSPGGTVEKVFKRYGRSFIATEEQKAYAVAVAEAIEAGHVDVPPIALYEASTGIGKSMGYLVPLAIAASFGERAVVSTSSLQLQSQILSPGGDFEIAAEVASVITKTKPVTGAVRKGRGNFIDTQRFTDFSNEIVASSGRMPGVAEFLARCHSWLLSTETGEIRELAELIDGIPSWVPLREISAEGSEESGFYDAHVVLAEDADIVITNHALLLTYAKFNSMVVGDAGEITNLVVDEADMIPLAAERILNDGVPLNLIANIVASLPTSKAQKKALKRISRLQEIAAEVYDQLESYGDRFGKGGNAEYLFLPGADLEKTRHLISVEMSGIYESLREVVDSNDDFKGDVRLKHEMMVLRQLSCLFSAKNIGRFSPVPTLRWSPTQKYFSLLASSVNPGSAIGRLWSPLPGLDEILAKSAILTSASLSVPSGDTDVMSENSIRDFAMSLGISKRLHPDFMKKFAPKTFGKAKFVLADPSAPLPTAKNAEAPDSNLDWLRYAAEMVAKATYPRNSKALVLTNSYRDAKDICEILSAMNVKKVILHRQGEKLGDILRRLDQIDSFALVTPAAWEGVNIRDLTDVIVTRIPFARPDSFANLKREQGLRAIGMDDDTVRGLLFSSSMNAAVTRMYQGWSRGIRRADQEVTLWTADPRFPLPENLARRMLPPIAGDLSAARARASYRRLQNSIAVRFREGLGNAYSKAKVFAYTPAATKARKRAGK